MISCPTRDDLRSYLTRDQALDAGQRMRIELHVETCTRCPEILEELLTENFPEAEQRPPPRMSDEETFTEDFRSYEPTNRREAPRRKTIGHFELLEKLGEGLQGVVYRARALEQVVEYDVAVKTVPAKNISVSAARRFVDEIRRLSNLRHDHIVMFLGSGEDDGELFYVMQLLPGSLAKAMKERQAPFDPHDAARIAEQIVMAIKYMHAHGVVHCDLKPHNILIDQAGKVCVADFGLAMLLTEDLRTAASRGICGTIPYLAPEQIDPRFGEIGECSDIYSLGVILFELLTLECPFPRRKPAILSILNSEPPSPSRLRAGIPNALERICLKCMKKEPARRYRSADELASDLKAFREERPLEFTPPNTLRQRFLHWLKSEPALASRLAVIVACSVIIWSSRLLSGRYSPLMPDHWANLLIHSSMGRLRGFVEAILVYASQTILIGWGLASWFFQRQLNRSRQEAVIQFGWRAVDVAAIVLLIALDDALMSPLPVAFAVLIVASAFGDRADQIIHTTLLSIAGYGLLLVSHRYFHAGQDRLYRHFHYLVGLALVGLILAYQANRTRALARICGERHRATVDDSPGCHMPSEQEKCASSV